MLHKLPYLLIFVFAMSLQSCFVGKAIETKKMKSEFTEENNAIPPDFGQDKEAVLLLKFVGTARDGYLKRAAKKNYDGPYEILKKNTTADVAFPDKKKYRYIFDHDLGTGYSVTGTTGMTRYGNFKRYFIYDRLTDKKYSCGAEFTFYAKGIRVYMDALNTKRNSFISGQ